MKNLNKLRKIKIRSCMSEINTWEKHYKIYRKKINKKHPIKVIFRVLTLPVQVLLTVMTKFLSKVWLFATVTLLLTGILSYIGITRLSQVEISGAVIEIPPTLYIFTSFKSVIEYTLPIFLIALILKKPVAVMTKFLSKVLGNVTEEQRNKYSKEILLSNKNIEKYKKIIEGLEHSIQNSPDKETEYDVPFNSEYAKYMQQEIDREKRAYQEKMYNKGYYSSYGDASGYRYNDEYYYNNTESNNSNQQNTYENTEPKETCNVKTNYFEKCKDENELKHLYRELVKKYHPDAATDEITTMINNEMFLKIKDEYEIRLKAMHC